MPVNAAPAVQAIATVLVVTIAIAAPVFLRIIPVPAQPIINVALATVSMVSAAIAPAVVIAKPVTYPAMKVAVTMWQPANKTTPVDKLAKYAMATANV